MNRREAFETAAAAAATVTLPLAAQARDNRPASADRSGHIKTEDGVDLFVKDWSKGRPIILTHAWPLSCDCWEQHAVALAEAGDRVISYDRRGFGRSAQPSGGYNYHVFADDLAPVIETTGIRDVTLAGSRWGGGEVLRYL